MTARLVKWLIASAGTSRVYGGYRVSDTNGNFDY
jgi:hypothetical protein